MARRLMRRPHWPRRALNGCAFTGRPQFSISFFAADALASDLSVSDLGPGRQSHARGIFVELRGLDMKAYLFGVHTYSGRTCLSVVRGSGAFNQHEESLLSDPLEPFESHHYFTSDYD
jgi:hypothetical protein